MNFIRNRITGIRVRTNRNIWIVLKNSPFSLLNAETFILTFHVTKKLKNGLKSVFVWMWFKTTHILSVRPTCHRIYRYTYYWLFAILYAISDLKTNSDTISILITFSIPVFQMSILKRMWRKLQSWRTCSWTWHWTELHEKLTHRLLFYMSNIVHNVIENKAVWTEEQRKKKLYTNNVVGSLLNRTRNKRKPLTTAITAEKCCCGFHSRNNYNIVKLICI